MAGISAIHPPERAASLPPPKVGCAREYPCQEANRMIRRRALEFPETPLHKPRRERCHVALEYRDNQQLEVAESLARPLTLRARQALGIA